MSDKIPNPLVVKMLADLDNLVKAEEVKTVREMEREINEAIEQAETRFAHSFSLPGRASKRKVP